MPTPNRGMQASAMAQLTWVIRILEKALPMVGVETELGKDVMKALTTLSKHLPAGSGSPGVEQQAMQKMMMEQKQEQPMLQLLRSQGQGQPGAAPPGGAAPPPQAA